MTYRIDVARSRDIVARWCALAEQRLEYLTELYETGRWRRFHSERAFFENLQEAKTAVEIWRSLATPDRPVVQVSWLGRDGAILHTEALEERVHRLSPPIVDIPVYSPQFEVAAPAETDRVYSDTAPSEPEAHASALDDASELVLNHLDAIEKRYPILRNALYGTT